MQIVTVQPTTSSHTAGTLYSSPHIVRQAYAGGYSAAGSLILTLEELQAYDSYPKGRGAEKRFLCPVCGDKEKAFNVNLETGFFNCKRSTCGIKGRLRDFWPERTQQNKGARKQAALTKAFGVLEERPTDRKTPNYGNWRQLWDATYSLDEAEAEAGREYLIGRGLDVQTAIHAGVRFSSNWAISSENKRYRPGPAVVYPIRDRAGDLIGANGRFLTPWKPLDGEPIKTMSGGDIEQGVFCAPALVGGVFVHPLEHEAPVLVEGPADALALAACGAPAIACVGVNLQQWLPMALAFKAPFVGSDADQGGDKAAVKWLSEIQLNAARASRLRPEGGKDFGEVAQLCGSVFLRSWLSDAGVVAQQEWESLKPLKRVTNSLRSVPTAQDIAAAIQWSMLSGAVCSRAVHKERLRHWDVLSAQVNSQLPETVRLAVNEANHVLLYFTRIITDENRELTEPEADEIQLALEVLEEATAGLIQLDNGTYDWIDPEDLADLDYAQAIEQAEAHKALKLVDEVLDHA